MNQLVTGLQNNRDGQEAVALENITVELAEQIFEQAKNSNSGDILSLHIKPSYENLGSVAHLRVVRKVKQADGAKLQRSGAAMDIDTFKEQLLAPAVERGRAGYQIEPMPLKLNLGDELISGTMALFVGIRRS